MTKAFPWRRCRQAFSRTFDFHLLREYELGKPTRRMEIRQASFADFNRPQSVTEGSLGLSCSHRSI